MNKDAGFEAIAEECSVAPSEISPSIFIKEQN